MPIDMSAAVKPPPRKASASAPRKAAQSKVDTRSINEIRNEGLQGLGQLGQGLCLMFGLYADAAAIGMHWSPVAREVANISDTHEFIGKGVDLLIAVGPYTALVQAVLPLGLQIAANHNRVSADNLSGYGVVPPQVLEAQMKANVARMQAQAMREQAEAQRDAERAQAEYEAYVRQVDAEVNAERPVN